MCDYSLMHLTSRPAVVGDKLVVRAASTNTRGVFDRRDESCGTAVCLLPGTEVAFDAPVQCAKHVDLSGWPVNAAGERRSTQEDDKLLDYRTLKSTAGIFAQVDKEIATKHHDAFHFPQDDGQAVLINQIAEGQTLTVLQLPAEKSNHQLATEACEMGSSH